MELRKEERETGRNVSDRSLPASTTAWIGLHLQK